MHYICDKTYKNFRYRFHYYSNIDSFIVDVYKNEEQVQRRLHINLREVTIKYEEHFPGIESEILNTLNNLIY